MDPVQLQPSFKHRAGKLAISLPAALSGNTWGCNTALLIIKKNKNKTQQAWAPDKTKLTFSEHSVGGQTAGYKVRLWAEMTPCI